MKNENMKVWARAGVTVTVNQEDFLSDPKKELRRALQAGAFVLDGETYIPDSIVSEIEEELADKGVNYEFQDEVSFDL